MAPTGRDDWTRGGSLREAKSRHENLRRMVRLRKHSRIWRQGRPPARVAIASGGTMLQFLRATPSHKRGKQGGRDHQEPETIIANEKKILKNQERLGGYSTNQAEILRNQQAIPGTEEDPREPHARFSRNRHRLTIPPRDRRTASA